MGTVGTVSMSTMGITSPNTMIPSCRSVLANVEEMYCKQLATYLDRYRCEDQPCWLHWKNEDPQWR